MQRRLVPLQTGRRCRHRPRPAGRARAADTAGRTAGRTPCVASAVRTHPRAFPCAPLSASSTMRLAVRTLALLGILRPGHDGDTVRETHGVPRVDLRLDCFLPLVHIFSDVGRMALHFRHVSHTPSFPRRRRCVSTRSWTSGLVPYGRNNGVGRHALCVAKDNVPRVAPVIAPPLYPFTAVWYAAAPVSKSV